MLAMYCVAMRGDVCVGRGVGSARERVNGLPAPATSPASLRG